jgi:iron complex outermembrane recepter protein
MKYVYLLILASVLIYPTFFPATIAQQQENEKDIFQLSLEELGNIVVTPSKFLQSIGNVTQKIDVINSREIETSISGNNNICEIIEKLPGASITALSRNDANWGTYGGIGPKYSTYMLQGLPLDAFVDPMSLDLNAIDHIEIQRGPASVFYPNYLSQDFAGNQSPLCGTINLILKQKIEQPKTSFRTSFGSYNTLNGQIYHQDKVGRLNYFCGSTYEISDYTNYGSEGSWLNMKKNPEYKKTKIYGGITLFMDEAEKQKFTIFLQKTLHNGDKGRVYQEYDYQYGTINAGYDIAFSDQFYFQSHLGIRSYDRIWQESAFGIVDTFKSNNGVNQIIIPMDMSFSWNHADGNILSIGMDFQSATYNTWSDPLAGYNIYGNKSSAVQGGIYAQEEWCPQDGLTLRGGLRYAYVKNKIALSNGNAPEHSDESWDNLLWSVGSRFNINSSISVFANGGSSFATPGLKSTAGTIPMIDFGKTGHDGQLPNPNLKSESGLGIDAGIDLMLPDNLKICIRGFYTIIKDAIVDNVVSRNPSQTQSINAGSSKSVGGEIDLSQKLREEISWYINATYMKSNIENDLDENQNDVKIPFSPDFILNVGADYYSSFGLTISPSINYNDGFYDGISKTGRSYFKPGIVANIYIAQILSKSDSFSVECFTQLYNITDNNYEMPWQFKNPGFSGMAGVKVTF